MPPPSTLDDLLHAYLAARDRGEPVPPEVLCRDRPELLADLLRRIQSALTTEIPRTRHPDPADPSATRVEDASPVAELGEGAELLPGYRLVRLLGRGGYGEVWETLAPGGFRVAFKLVSLEGRAGEIELQALEIIRNLRHPNLLTVFGTWQTGGRLVIGMELADATLHDELKKARAAGAAGLPRRPLIRWSLDAARVIDYLNKPRHFFGGTKPVGIQHGDIKPQNILLVGQGVKVGDFGLVRLLRGSVERHDGGMTLSFAAPEVLEGRVSRWSDQYSLAVTWCQLRGGRLPFAGESVLEIVCKQREQEPDLSMLPEEERPAVARALACDPRRRWPDCRAFVKALADCRARPAEAASSERPEPAASPRPRPSLPAGAAPATPLAAQPTLRTSLPRPGRHLTRRGSRLVLLVSALLLAGSALGFGVFVASLARAPQLRALRPGVPGALARRSESEMPPAAAGAEPREGERPGLIERDGRPTKEMRVEEEAAEPERRTRSLVPPPSPEARVEARGADRPPIQARPPAARGGPRAPSGGPRPAPVETTSDTAKPPPPHVWSPQSPVAAAPVQPPPPVRFTPPPTAPVVTAPSPPAPPVSTTAALVDLAVAAVVAVAVLACGWVLIRTLRRGRARPSAVPADADAATVRPAAIARESGPSEGARFGQPEDAGAEVIPYSALATAPRCYGGHTDAVWALAVAPDGSCAASAGMDPAVRLWDFRTFHDLRAFEGHPEGVTAVAFAAGGQLVASAGLDGEVCLWPATGGAEPRRLAGHHGRVFGVAGAPDGRTLASCGEDGTVRVWDAESGAEVRRLQGHAGWVYAVAFANGRIVSAGADGTVRLWDPATGAELRRLQGHAGAVRCLTASPDGSRAVSGGEDSAAIIWDLDGGRELRRLSGHTDWVRAAARTPDGRRVVTGGDDETVCVWDAATGELLHRFADTGGSILCLAVTPDSRFALAGGDDATVRAFALPT